ESSVSAFSAVRAFVCGLSAMTADLSRCCLFFKDTAPTEISTLSLHDALPIFPLHCSEKNEIKTSCRERERERGGETRSEEHTSELQSHLTLVCRLLLVTK